tara:strand:- start:236 stop:595 length:360 start_codon:yes stop_codon:yes gene_type:complete
VGELTRGQKVIAVLGEVPFGGSKVESPFCAKYSGSGAKKTCVSSWFYIPALKGWAAGTVGKNKFLQGTKPTPAQLAPSGPVSLPPPTVVADDSIPVAPFVAAGVVVVGLAAFFLWRASR